MEIDQVLICCRFDDPLLLERYRMMQNTQLFSYPHHGMLPSPGVHPLLPGARYPADLLSQHPLSYLPSAGASKLPNHISPASAADRYRK